MESPFLMENESTKKIFAPDAIKRAQAYLDHLNVNGTGNIFLFF